MLSHAHPNIASLEAEIAILGADLAALQDMARSLPSGMTVPHDKRSAFAELEIRVNRQFDQLSCVLATVEDAMLH